MPAALKGTIRVVVESTRPFISLGLYERQLEETALVFLRFPLFRGDVSVLRLL